jgi:hypothetical protein
MNRKFDTGTTTVEFAIVAAALLMMIFSVLEVGRTYYVYAMLDEVTRRAARLAAVCPVNDPAIPRLAIFNASGDASESSLVKNLMPANVVIDYLDETNTVVASPSVASGFAQIRYVRARVVGFQHEMYVPFADGLASFFMNEFESILPRESLGIPREGAIRPC